jgi:hypothetical protein
MYLFEAYKSLNSISDYVMLHELDFVDCEIVDLC